MNRTFESAFHFTQSRSPFCSIRVHPVKATSFTRLAHAWWWGYIRIVEVFLYTCKHNLEFDHLDWTVLLFIKLFRLQNEIIGWMHTFLYTC